DGLTIYPGNVHSLEDQLIYLLQNPVEATRMAKTAKEKVEKAYRWDHIARETQRIYHTKNQEDHHESHYPSGWQRNEITTPDQPFA
ncbi:MAG TPA: glycosyltransferase, partial [Bacillota bacterium]|nr:glycosyltransferase [Bacillota bacterium]